MRLIPICVKVTVGVRKAVSVTTVAGVLLPAQAVTAGRVTVPVRTPGSATGAFTSQCPAAVSVVRVAAACCPAAGPS